MAEVDYYAMVEDAWRLSDAARDYAAGLGRPPTVEEYWEAVFAASPLVDRERTEREGGRPLARLFLRSPYGLRHRPEHNDWIPFRHGEIDLAALGPIP
ncbi:MAG TPA: hypothetical protein VEH84_17600 [Alphaproteobacteria bacterium]|nr:hypothetical protein [Alphaproteobacteria bacterium]